MMDRINLDLREVTKADVHIGEVLAAHLTRGHGDAVSFDYVAEETGEGRVRDRSVSRSLLRSGEYPVITRRRGRSTFLPLPLFEPERDNDFHAVFAKLTGSIEADPVGMAGVQPKVSASMMSTPTQTRTGPAILKLNPAGFPLLVENEHFFMRMASACGLRAAQTTLLHDGQGRSALLVNRFDRVGPRRIPQEDACQVTDLYPASKYRIKTETALTELADACGRGGGSRVIALSSY